MPALTVHLPELAQMLGLSLNTLYGDWDDRERRGEIPPRLRGHKRPTWSRQAVEARLNGEDIPLAPARKTAATARATSRLGLMSGNT